MSSSNDEQDPSKKRKIQRACDICRRKKIRCDGVQMPDRCSNCIAYGFECSYVEPAKKRGPPKGYVEGLEIRVEKIERLLQTLLPEADLARELSGASVARWQNPPVVDEDERTQFSLIENLQRLSLSSDRDSRFFGRSSGAMLLQTALNLKLESEPQNARRHTEFWASRPSPEPVLPPQYDFPPPDLVASLVDLYFAHVNLLLPLLHRPTFVRDLATGLHLTNDGFAATLLLVCAIGSRFSSDPRVLLDGTDSLHSCGWRWFEQLQLMRDPLGPPPCLYDLQFSALSVIFLHGTSAPQSCWTLVSIGIRMAQDVGAHRRKAADHRWTAEDELWKRAFWVLVFLDRMASADYGRPCAIQDEDFDLDFPIDCDDEYWETTDPAQAFHQPAGKPSRIVAFILYLRLCQVLSFALRTIYSINKSKVLLGLSKTNNNDWEHRIVVELDTTLNKWIDDVPDHLRWNPTHEHPDFFEQSVALHCSYYHLQILIHRPYIPNPKKIGPSAFPSLAICLNAARSCSHVVDIHRQRTGDKPLPLAQMAVFTSGIVLLLNIWGGKRSGLGLATDSSQEMAEVHRCMQALRVCEMRWQSAGKLWDILYELASVGQLPLPASANTKNKRERGAEEPKSSTGARPEHGHGSLSPLSESSSGNGSPEETLMTAERRQPPAPDVPNIMANGANLIPEGRPIAGGRRLHTSDVPAIATQFLPHFHHRSPAYGPETPLSTSSLRPDRFLGLTHGDESQRRRAYPGPPDTPLSTSSIHSQQQPEPFVPSMQRDESQHYGLTHPHLPDTPLSASSMHKHHQDFTHRSDESQSRHHPRPEPPLSASSVQSHHQHIPFVPSMSAPIEFSQSRRMIDDNQPTGVSQENPYWYSDRARTASTSHEHSPIHLPSSGNSTITAPRIPLGSTSSFPMSEAFYEQLTASFSSVPHDGHHYHRHPTSAPVNYPAQARQDYPDGGARHRTSRSHGFVAQSPQGVETHPHLNRDARGGDDTTASGIMDPEAMAIWSAAPMGFELDDWGPYLDTVNDMTQARMHAGGTLP